MRLFLTGGTGFVGSYVLAAALAEGHEVLALRRSPDRRPVVALPTEPNWCTGILSTIKAEDLKDVDIVLHLASSGVSPKQASLGELIESNINGTLRLLNESEKANVRRCVIAGTCHEYGTAAEHYSAIPPNASLEPVSLYGASKAAAFQMTRAFAVEYGIELFYGRIFSAYGEGQFEKNFWPALRRAALNGDDFKMTKGQQISDFIRVSDVAKHLLEACIRPDIKAYIPHIVNIGSGISSSLLDFARQQWILLEAKGKILDGAIPERPNQIKRYVPDLTGLRVCYNLANGEQR